MPTTSRPTDSAILAALIAPDAQSAWIAAYKATPRDRKNPNARASAANFATLHHIVMSGNLRAMRASARFPLQAALCY